jgi:RNA polymerase sigma factor (sigma-70 family)
MTPPSDGALVARCRTGDEAAWEELVDRFSRYVFAIATRAYGLRESDAEEVFQEVFTRIWERLGTLRDDDAVRPWIAQLTRRCCVDHLRAAGRESVTLELDELEAEDVIEELDEALAVRHALAQLSPECRDVLDRFFGRDESYHTICASLDLPQGTVASRISRCLAKLREQLEGRNPSPTPSGAQVIR